MMTLSKLNQELGKANNYKSKLTEDYNRKLQEANNHINRLETDIRSFISVGDANTYNQLKSATELLTPLGYQDSIKSVVFLLNSGFKVYLKDFKEMLIKTLFQVFCIFSDKVSPKELQIHRIFRISVLHSFICYIYCFIIST